MFITVIIVIWVISVVMVIRVIRVIKVMISMYTDVTLSEWVSFYFALQIHVTEAL